MAHTLNNSSHSFIFVTNAMISIADIINVVVSGILLGTIYSLFSIGLNLIFGVMKIINFAQGEFIMLGMYIAYLIWLYTTISPYVALPIIFVIFLLYGFLMYLLIGKRLIGKSDTTQILSTVGLALVLQNLCLVIFKADYYMVNLNLPTVSLIEGIYLRTETLIAGSVAIAIMITMYYFITKTGLGNAIRATSQNLAAASTLGINPNKMFAIAWGIGSASVGVAGALFVTYYTVSYSVSPLLGLISFVVVVMGGLGSFEGGLIAGVILGVVEIASGYFISSMLRYFFVFIAFLITLILLPGGIGEWLNSIRLERELKRKLKSR